MAVLTLPEEVTKEIAAFGREIERLQSGVIPEEKFKRFRLQHGVYGQRQPGVQMVRVKIPAGLLTGDQLRGLADVAERYSTGKGHITTRQDVQFHFIKLDDITATLTRLAEAGLTTREACGNTVRNVTACHLAGICPTELFDVTPYSQAVAYHLLRNPINQDLPRKFKISFSGCTSECGLASIHDIGLIATSRPVDGAVEYGFRLFVGGGLGSSPRLAKHYTDFLPVDELLPTCEAILKLFDTHGDRKIRSKARMKFILEKWGLEKFKEEVARERAILAESGKVYPTLPVPIPKNALCASQNGHAAGLGMATESASANGEYERWRRTNIIPQPDPDLVAVQVRVVIGDLSTAEFRGMADIVDQFGGGAVRATHQQNFILQRVRRADLPALHRALAAAGLGPAGAEQAVDVIACPGTDSCQLGLTSSMGLGAVLTDTLQNDPSADDVVPGLRIRISGCPNSCAQHHIAGIGLHGVAKKIHGQLVPHYQLHLGGGVDADHSAIGKPAIKIPAKNVSAAVMEIVRTFRENHIEGESFNPFVARFGKEAICQRLEPLTHLPPPTDAPESYLDYKSNKPFDLEDLGPGECAGTMIDLIENHLRMAGGTLEAGVLSIKRGQAAAAVTILRDGVLRACRALLVPFGIDSPQDDEILKSFQHKVVEQGIVSERFEALTESLGQWAAPPSTDATPQYLSTVAAFIEECKAAYDQMDSNMKLKKRDKEGAMSTENKYDVYLDLSGVTCPMNFVKTKLQLEEMDAGQILHVILDEGEPIQNVPKSVQAEGHKVLEVSETADGHYNMVVEKVE